MRFRKCDSSSSRNTQSWYSYPPRLHQFWRKVPRVLPSNRPPSTMNNCENKSAYEFGDGVPVSISVLWQYFSTRRSAIILLDVNFLNLVDSSTTIVSHFGLSPTTHATFSGLVK